MYFQAQDSGLSIDFNLGTNPTSPLSSYHKSLRDQVNLQNFETTDNFSYNYGFSVGFSVKGINSNIFYANRVSGAKSSISDFSGFLRLTNELTGHTIGYKYFLPLKVNEKSSLFVQLKGMVTFSNLDIVSDSEISGSPMFESLGFKSTDFGLGAGILYEYPVSFIILRAYLDIDIYYGGKLSLKGTSADDGFLIDDSGNKLTTGWSGLTSGIGIAIPM